MLIITLFCWTNLFSQEYIKKYSAAEECFFETVAQAVSIYEVEVKDFAANKKEIKARIKHTITPFGQIIDKEIKLKLKKSRYEFSFIDGWGNHAYGWIDSDLENPTLFLDCKKFSSEGKNYARLYGASIELHETSDDNNFFEKAIDENNKTKKILNEKNNTYFPSDDEEHILKVLYIGAIKDIEIYKTTLAWNLQASGRMTHRLVFVRKDKVIGIYTGIQSDKIVVNKNMVLFKDIELDNIIEINNTLPEKILIDGEIIYLEK